ncbi:MAG: GNAT family N-acetyltransferase [Planctomycetota bacterium]|nr:MAG: GNAT family N-acetyltransferase [Planctomycetota bacterium]
MKFRKADSVDLDHIARIYKSCFPKELNHKLWVESSFKSYPRGVYYVIEIESVIVGYILWCVKNGFRANTIVELEQIGVDPNFSGKGLGRKLIEDSFEKFKTHVKELGHGVRAVMVTTSEGNFAEELYKSTLGVSRSAIVEGYGSGNEVILYNNQVDGGD